MGHLRIMIYQVLNQIKGFNCGYKGSVKDKIMIDYDGKRYVVTIQEVEKFDDSLLMDMDNHI